MSSTASPQEAEVAEPPKLTFGQILLQLRAAKEAKSSLEHLKNIDLAVISEKPSAKKKNTKARSPSQSNSGIPPGSPKSKNNKKSRAESQLISHQDTGLMSTKPISESICQVSSTVGMFEIFNKRGYKCSGVVIPDTIIVNASGALTDWYFYSPIAPKGTAKNYCDDPDRNGVILKKNRETITDESVYVALYNNSLLSQFSIQAFETSQIAGNQLFTELKAIFTTKVTNEIIKELKFLMPEQSLNDQHKYIDSQLPYIAFVRTWDSDKPGRGYRPLELFELIFFQKLYRVKMFQPYVYARGTDLVNPTQNCVVSEFKGQSSINKKVKDSVMAYWRKAVIKDPNTKLKGTGTMRASNTGFNHMQDQDYVRYFNPVVNDQARLQTLDLINYLQKANGGVRVIGIKPKFIESQQPHAGDIRPKLFLVGIKDEIFIDTLGTPLQSLGSRYSPMQRDFPDGSDYIFSSDTIKDPKKSLAQTKPIDPHSGCAGAFCNFLEDRGLNPHQNMTLVNMAQGSKVKEELEKQQKIVPKRNHISINSSLSQDVGLQSLPKVAPQGQFMITGLLIKRVADNMEMAERIIEGHYGQSAANRMIGKFFRNTIGSIIGQKNFVRTLQGNSPLKLPDVKRPMDLQKKKTSTSLRSTQNDLGKSIKRDDQEASAQKPPKNPAETRKNEYREAMHEPQFWTPVKRKNKVQVRDTFDSMYNGVKVCRQCYEIYLLLKDYFDELLGNNSISLRNEKDATKTTLSQSASKLHLPASEIIQEARSFSHSTIALNYLEGRRLVGGEKRDKTKLIENLQVIVKDEENNLSTERLKKGTKHVTEGFVHIATQQSDSEEDDEEPTVLKKVTQAQLVKIKPKVSLKIVTKEHDQIGDQTGMTSMFNTKTQMNVTKKPRLIKNSSIALSLTHNSQNKTVGSPGKRITNLAQIQRRMTILGQKKNMAIYQAAAGDTEMSIKFTSTIVAQVREQKEQQRQLELSCFNQQRANSAEQVPVINFFMEVSKDQAKFRLNSPPKIPNTERDKNNSSLLQVPEKSKNQNKSSRNLNQASLEVPTIKALVPVQVSSKQSLVLSPVGDSIADKNENSPSEEISLKSGAQLKNGILKLLKIYLTQKIAAMDEQERQENQKSTSNLLAVNAAYNDPKASSDLDLDSTIQRLKANQLNITSSIFHQTNLVHLKHIPFYRISTPKAPIFSIEEERGQFSSFVQEKNQEVSNSPNLKTVNGSPQRRQSKIMQKQVIENTNNGHHDKYLGAPHPEDDDLYIIPFENYSTMTIKNYVELMTTKQTSASANPAPFFTFRDQQADVFLVDEFTSILYLVVAPAAADYPNPDLQSSYISGSQQSGRPGVATVFVLLDFYDSFHDKIEYFKSLANELKTVRFILTNLPGQLGTQFNPNRNTVLNNYYHAQIFDLLISHLHDKGIVNFMEGHSDYSIVGFGSGANIALYYLKEMLMNDTTSAIKSLVLINPFTNIDQNMVASLNNIMAAADQPEQLLLETLLHAKNVKKDAGQVTDGFKWPVSGQDRQIICQGLLRNLPVTDKLSQLQHLTPHLGEPPKIHLIYSRGNQLVGYKHCESILKATMEKGKGTTTKPKQSKVQIIDGGHNVFHDNPTGLKKCLTKVMNFIPKAGGTAIFQSDSSMVQFELLSGSRLATSEMNLS